MSLSVLALEATSIVIQILSKVANGTLEKAGSDILDFLRARFEGRLKIEETVDTPQLLEAAIVSEAQLDSTFEENLEKLIERYQSIQKTYSVSQSTESGVNLSVDENTGTIIGQKIDQRQQFFR